MDEKPVASVFLDNVSKHYGDVVAVRDLTLRCRDGEMLALLGPSGCGKSSTLKMITGIEHVTRGEIFFDERPVAHLAPGERNIAMVFEDYALYPHLTTFDNIAFPLKIRKWRRKDIESRVSATLELLDLTANRNDYPQNMSGGMQQRISIGRALVREPELILFDEPLSHLDGDQKVHLRSEIKRLQNASGLTAILVTHDQTEAVAMADFVAVLSQGELQQLATPEELYARPANVFVAGFIGEPPMNLLSAECLHRKGQLTLFGPGWHVDAGAGMTDRILGAADSDAITVGVRPEHISLKPTDVDRCAEGEIFGRVTLREVRGDTVVFRVALLEREGQIRSEGAGRNEFVVEVVAPTDVAEGCVVALRFSEREIHLFDSRTGRILQTG